MAIALNPDALPLRYRLDFEGVDVSPHGPAELDRVTVEALAENIRRGLVTFPIDPSALIEACPQERFDQLFIEFLNQSPLTADDVYAHRALALARTIKSLIDGGPESAPVVGGQIPEAGLETWVALAMDRIPLRFDAAQRALLADLSFWVTPDELALMTQIPVSTLSAWRQRGVGPAFMKIPVRRPSIRYPVVGLAAWLADPARAGVDDD